MRVGGGAVEEIGEVVAGLGLARPLVVTDKFLVGTGAVDRMVAQLEAAGLRPAVFAETVPDPTTASLDAGAAAVAEHDADCVIGFGGGSPMDTAKALGLLARKGGHMRDYKVPRDNIGPALPVIAVPTTAGSGSEATQFTIISDSESDEKMLCTGQAFLPVAAIVDYRLTMTMPPRLTADTGVDALTHAIEAYVSRKANPFSDSLALVAIDTIGQVLRRVYADGQDAEARERMMLAATQAGIAFSNSSVALVHGMSRPIGAHFHVAHGLSNAMLFPAVTEFSVDAAESRYADCARALGAASADASDATAAADLVVALKELCRDVEVPTPKSYGIDKQTWDERLPVMAEQALASGSPNNNPRIPTAEEIRDLYGRIYA
ncbi:MULTISPECIES: iron-containing alcohol dehydrogenase [Rhodococcus]|uniref:iron-containing alcohol dehydrogenase n=1 Tax=Rhodococcus TaxID=1827 RepID=UPI001E31F9B5|nr:iron-containing alcohol dehydrogenase [Rhodococcus pyridinivorans]MCD2117763.1 iron-containing alcohol dehydrogenase [Rhodococcus pyridinivorans]MCZ4626741.1 iron-containing alcohol dehydrogenase [Rhodococcus pyridinivorans]MCZ4647844.1 iron-containing alcohol dehydrogenase [Rhodococcus pyridinivorans]MDJ0484214.1 iron-containing alcohol dehydrogenase [Rhodococcus pyridinivorans]MDV7253925.1 iron-containing alcohol dehydrogenase [Rhodococcus pyridinivorans]